MPLINAARMALDEGMRGTKGRSWDLKQRDVGSDGAGNLPEGLFHELPDSEVVDKSVLSSETYVQGDEDLDDLQKQLEALNAPWAVAQTV